MTAPRRLPGIRTGCPACRREIVYALTVAGPNGPGGKRQAFDPFEDPAGRVAIIPLGRGRLHARALHKGETHDEPLELLGMPHVATCPGAPAGTNPRLPDEVADLAAARAKRGAPTP